MYSDEDCTELDFDASNPYYGEEGPPFLKAETFKCYEEIDYEGDEVNYAYHVETDFLFRMDHCITFKTQRYETYIEKIHIHDISLHIFGVLMDSTSNSSFLKALKL